MGFGEHPADEAYSVVCPFEGLFLTSTGGLLGAIELSGIDPDAQTMAEATRLAVMTANILGALPLFVAVTQHYVHAEGHRITLRDRPAKPLAHRLSKAREAALNSRGLATARLVHLFHYTDPAALNSGLGPALARLPMLAFDHAERRSILARLRAPQALLLREQELHQRAQQLRKVLADAAAKWSLTMEAKVLGLGECWRFIKFLGNFDPGYLDTNRPMQVPTDDLAVALANGDVQPVQVDWVDMLKIHGARPRYVRFAAVTKTPANPVGLWSLGNEAPIRARGNFMLTTHFSPLTELARSLKFRSARNNLERMRLDLKALFLADQIEESGQAPETLLIRKKRAELERAEAIEDRWGLFFSNIALFDSDPRRLIQDCDRLHTVLTARGIELAWEVAGLPVAYKAVQAAGQAHSVRNATVTLSRAAAMSLSARSATGAATVPDLAGEEAQYVLETADGQPFWYSPYVGGRAFTIAVGPTRSGKTFFKNTLSAHFLKYGGFVRALDIDPGTEALAAAWGKDGGVVRLDAEADGRRKGLNPFVAAGAGDDIAFVAHLLDLGQALLAANDTAETQTLERHEQLAFDAAVQATLRLPPAMRSLEHLVAHLPRETQEKFARWVSGGAYDGIFNAIQDGIGALDTPLGVINLQAYRDDLRVLRPLFLDLFFRVSRLFEAAPHRALPKQLDIDEAHHPLAIAAFRAFLLKKVRTWAKYNASITLWTQSPGDYLAIDGWDAIRTAASTFIFLADGQMDEDLYKRAFRLSDGMCAAIRRLVPRREAFIVQPEIGIAKTVILEAEPEQRIINTSHPRDVALRDRLIAEHGFEEGLKRAVAVLAME